MVETLPVVDTDEDGLGEMCVGHNMVTHTDGVSLRGNRGHEIDPLREGRGHGERGDGVGYRRVNSSHLKDWYELSPKELGVRCTTGVPDLGSIQPTPNIRKVTEDHHLGVQKKG